MSDSKRCKICVLPESFPGIKFDKNGVCKYCTSSEKNNVFAQRSTLREKMSKAIKETESIGSYDCIVALSGGKDSTYTLKLLREDFELNCLAVTIDNGFLSDQAKKNCRTITDFLGVDFIEFKPAKKFMNNMYKKSLEGNGVHTRSAISRASDICNSCINLINNTMIKVALQHKTPIIAGGYIGGQVPKDAAIIDYNLEQHTQFNESTIKRVSKNFGIESKLYFGIPLHLINQKSIKIINPMLTVSLTEEEIVDEVSNIGWNPSNDTGLHSSNCKLNDLGIYHHHKKYGFHPYVFEIADQVRSGLMNREDALNKIENIPRQEDVKVQSDALRN